jgi:hypothetical protein
MWSIPTEIRIGKSTVSTMLQEDLLYESYAKERGQLMSEATKARWRRAEEAGAEASHHPGLIVILF